MNNIPHYIYKILEAGILYAFLTLVQRLLHKKVNILSKSPIALNLIFLMFSINIFLIDLLSGINENISKWNIAAILLIASYLAIKIFDLFLFDMLLNRRRKAPVPVMLRDIFRWILVTMAVFIIVRAIFPNVNLNVLAVSSIVTGYVVGNATQETLGNLIAGLALNTESPFTIGDWVQIAGHTGRIVDMTWRATCLRTKTDDYIIIPNDAIARASIINYSRPTTVHGYLLEIGVSYSEPPNKVRRVILEVLKKVDKVLDKPAPCVWLVKYNDFSIDYKIKFYIRDFANLENIESRIMDLIWYSFKRNGITIPFPIRDVNLHQVTPEMKSREEQKQREERTGLFAGIEILSPLSHEQLLLLADEMREEIYAEGEVILHQGETGSTFYIIKSGEIEVTIRQGGRTVKVARLEPGDFFGEMSFLTGEKCNATVTAVTDCVIAALPHTVLGSILESSENLAEKMAEILEKRMRTGEVSLDAPDTGADSQQPPPVARQIFLQRIRNFFSLD